MTLECAIEPSQPDVRDEYVWTKDGLPLDLTNGISVAAGSGDLTIQNIQEEDNGLYNCSVRLSVDALDTSPLNEAVGSSVVTVDGECAPIVSELIN